jgi:hypothetical protein
MATSTDDASLLNAMPFFQEKSAFDQCLPNLTMQQVFFDFVFIYCDIFPATTWVYRLCITGCRIFFFGKIIYNLFY